jgi:hypothetical protein
MTSSQEDGGRPSRAPPIEPVLDRHESRARNHLRLTFSKNAAILAPAGTTQCVELWHSRPISYIIKKG